MPSLKKRVTGFIRQLSAPGTTASAAAAGPGAEREAAYQRQGSHNHASVKKNGATRTSFIQKYLDGESRRPCVEIWSGKTGHELPVFPLASLNPEVFAAFTGPAGGITSMCKSPDDKVGSIPEGEEGKEDFDYIDVEEMSGRAQKEDPKSSRRESSNHLAAPVSERKSSVENVRPKESSVERDYPELSGDLMEMSKSSDACGSIVAADQVLARKLKRDLKSDCDTVIAGVRHWSRPNNSATGQAVTLYERHPHTAEHAGNPIADTFAIVARKNSAILVLGDGVNWGPKAALASRCAVFACIDHLNTAIFGEVPTVKNTQEVFQSLLRSFHAAHSLILQEEAQLTTLTACVVIPVMMKDEEKMVACVCNVGDSLAYVYDPSIGQVREITQDSHDIRSNRDMRDALGALGPVDGINPELNNLTCSMTLVNSGDIVFLTSDGISDNFDPVVGKFCVPTQSEDARRKGIDLPSVEAFQRHELTLLRMEDILNQGWEGSLGQSGAAARDRVFSAAELCSRMVDFCQRLTTAKRKILEDPELYPEHTRHAVPDSDATRLDQKLRRRKVCEKLALVPGKLDHATLVAYAVEDRRKSMHNFTALPPTSTLAAVPSSQSLGLRAPCASAEDLTCRDSPEPADPDEAADDATTPSASSLASSTGSLNCGSLAITPVHRPVVNT